ncbi:hypothetical protein CHS0354_027889 [Potamilus streckersoni]|uniref:MAM domain-containing protein n=1 Tax=Potamilus streckersoni TaxID=2493646 RepID=A0AAE0W7I8_9BIVA|nr:hypothetical protein CHS0354_027889 [Potamilus streckersoni]
MTFWFHMNGVGIGSLKVYTNDQSGSRKLAWQRVGRQGPDWNQGHVRIDTDVQQVIFMATTRFHYGSDLAIDDIVMDPNPLVLTTVSQTYPSTASQTYPSTSPPRRYLTCDFEINLCGWEQDGELQWELKRGASPDRTSGIVDDHTLLGGRQYAFFNGHKAVNSSYVARLDSGQVFFQPGVNISFWYHMNGAGIGSLKLLQRTPYGNVLSLWSRTGRQSPEWLKAEVNLPPGLYNLTFEVSAQHHFSSDIGLDDIVLSEETIS